MVKQIIGETFGQLGTTVKQTGQQIMELPGEIAEESIEQTGAKGQPQPTNTPRNQPLNQAQIAQKQAQTRQRLTVLEEELEGLRKQKTQELPKYITGKPGFSEEKAIEQIEEKEKEEEKLPPVVVSARRRAGTGERRIRGAGGV